MNSNATQQALVVFGDAGKATKEGRIDVSLPIEKLQVFLEKIRGLEISRITENRFDLEKYFLDFYRSDRVFEEL